MSVLYALLRSLLGPLSRSERGEVSEIENAVLRHQLKVLRRQVRRPKFRPFDRVFLAAAAHVLPRDRFSSFLVTPQTLLRWNRELVLGGSGPTVPRASLDVLRPIQTSGHSCSASLGRTRGGVTLGSKENC
jgi:hypothetical protein